MRLLLTVSALLCSAAAESQPSLYNNPRHVQMFGSPQALNRLYSNNYNPFQPFLAQQSPAFRQSYDEARQPSNIYPALPTFIQPEGEQPLVYHPNYGVNPLPLFGAQLTPEYSGNNVRRFQEPARRDGFNRGHVEFHPQQQQVQTYSSFRNSETEDDSLMSRAAVESRPIIAEAYTASGSARFEEAETVAFDRGHVEAFPAGPTPYSDDFGYDDEDIGYGKYGQAGRRAAVESRPIFTELQDPSEAYPMLVQANTRPFGHLSESVLYNDQRSIGNSLPTAKAYYHPRMEGINPDYKLLCYYESWSAFRPAPQDFTIDRIDPFGCTHVLYSFVGLDPSNYTITSLIPDYDIVRGAFKSIVALKAQNPDLKVLVAIGGWNEGGKRYSDMVSSPDLRSKFVKSAVDFVTENHFDGLDINWEYPGASDRGGRTSDKENFALLVKELSNEFKPRNLLLSAAVSPARFRVNEGYDVPMLSQYLDWLSVITYDLRGPWDGKADHNAPIINRAIDSWTYRNLNVHDAMQYWVDQGAPAEKLILGVPFYARTYTLENPTNNQPGARIRHPGLEGEFTREAGFLAYYEVCSNMLQGGWEERRDEIGAPFMINGDQWVGFDDAEYIIQKMELVKAKSYGGAMVWAVDLDDQLGICGEKWPLLNAVRKGLSMSAKPSGFQPGPMTVPEPSVPQPESQPKPEPEPEPQPQEIPPPSTRETTEAPQQTTDGNRIAGPASGSKCTGSEYVADPFDCQYFLICVGGEYRRSSCADGLVWNDVSKNCDWPENTNCKSSGSPSPAPPPPPPPPMPDSGGMKPDSGTSSQQGSTQLEKVSSSGKLDDSKYWVVCYFTNWAWYRPGIGKYTPDDIDPSLCTHIVYGFAVLDYSTLLIKPHDSWADIDNKFYEKVVALKKKGIKVSLAIGGWNDSLGDKYSRLVNDPNARRRFTEHVIVFLQQYNFDGLDLDWEYPKCWQVDCTKGPASDKQAFVDWVRELKEAFRPYGLLLSAAVSPSKKVIDAGYDVAPLNTYLDWIAVMTYDYHGQWDKKTGHVAPSRYHPEDDYDYFNMDFTIRYWLEKGATRDKLVLGMPMYGQSFTLNDPNVNGLNAPARTGGTAGEFTRAKGFLAYYEICDRILNRGWNVVKDPDNRMGPYAYKGNQWVSFDDVDTIRQKSQYILDLGLRGAMIWALDLDDFTNRCGQGAHPLLTTIKNVLGSGVPSPSRPDEAVGVTRSTEDPIGSPSGSAIAPVEENRPTGTQTGTGSQAADDRYKVVCYFTNWAWYRQGEGKYLPEDIDVSICTHIVYGFAVLDGSRLLIKPHDTWADYDNKFYEKVTATKSNGVKVLLAIGGWNDSAGGKYSKLVNSPGARRKFTDHVIKFIQKHNFDGLDLDWEYPKCWQVDCKKGPASDKQAFSAWVMELKTAFQKHNLLLSAAVSPSNKVIDAGYEVPVLSKYLDWIAVMTYDYHGQWDKKTGHVAPMYMHPEDDNPYFNTNFTINYWLQNGADPKKLVLGMPMYGQSFTLSQSRDNGLNQKTYGGGEAGAYTRARGFLAYYEICYKIKNGGFTVVRDDYGTMGPYAYKGNQWVGFDDIDVIRYKSEYIKQLGLGGGMIWALDLDDFKDRCGCGKYPLLKTISHVLRNVPSQAPQCEVLGGGPPTQLMPFGHEPYERITTTPAPTTVPSWMTWQTTRRRTTTTERTTTRRRTTTRAPWLPPKTTKATRRPESTTRRTTPWSTTRVTGACMTGEFQAHPSDCNKFFQCINGEFIERQCYLDRHFQRNRCVRKELSNCAGGQDMATKENPDQTTAAPWERPKTTRRRRPWEQTTTTTRRPWQQTTTTRRPWEPTTTIRTTRRPWQPPSTTIPPWKTQKPWAPTTTTTEYPWENVEHQGESEYKVVCYFTNWAWYRNGVGKYKPQDIDITLCTHIVYGFAVLDGSNLVMKPHDRWADLDNYFYEKVTSAKRRGVKVLIAIGGWNDSAGDKYSRLVNNAASRGKFTNHVIEFIKKHNFDGLDLDWEYPKCWQVNCKKGPESDKPAFSAWIKELYEAFQPHGLLLSAAVSPNPKVIDAGYEVPELNRYLDWIAVMTYDYHGHWDKKTGHVAPMYHHPDSTTPNFNANYTINYWLSHGASPKKIIMGMPMYGQSFSLASTSDTGINVKARGKGTAGQFTRAAGFLAYYEICHKIQQGGYTVVKDPEGNLGPYAYKGNQWFSYDDIEMIRYKSEYVKKMGLGGAMIWALDLDDFRNRCRCEPHPLLRTINRVLRNNVGPDPGCNI